MEQINKIIIIEDDKIVREYLKNLIKSATNFTIEADFGSAEEALSFIDQCPDKMEERFFLVDIHLPQKSGIEFVDILTKNNEANCIMLTVFDDDKHIFDAIKAGAVGYILKNDSSEKIIEALNDVLNGGSPINGRVARRIIKELATIPCRQLSSMLTFRENEVLELLAKGNQLKEISTKLFISKDTVKTHVKNIYKKLHVSSRRQAIALYNKV